MNSELYYSQLSDLVVSKRESTILSSDGRITNLLSDEALVKEDDILKPLPWTKYSKQQVKHYIAQLKNDSWIFLDPFEQEFLVKIKQKYRLKALINFLKSENKSWQQIKSKESIMWMIDSGYKLSLKSFSVNENYLIIPHRLSTFTREIALPTNFSLLIDPYFQDRYYKAIFIWIELMTEPSINEAPSSYQINECLELLKVVLQDLGDNVVDISNEVTTLHVETPNSLMAETGQFSFVLDNKAGLSIQLLEKKSHKAQRHIRNLDLDPLRILKNPNQWTRVLYDLIHMHMYDINLQTKLNFD